MNRRLFLRGVGGAALAVPFLSSLRQRRAQAAEGGPIKRSVIFYTHYGCIVPRWYDKLRSSGTTGVTGAIDSTMLGDTLKPLQPYVDKLLFPQNISMFPRGTYSSHFDPHDQGMGSKLTCSPLAETGLFFPQGHSLDWEIARRINPAGTTQSPLVLHVGSFFANMQPALDVKSYLSYSGVETPYKPETNPANVYSSLTKVFSGGSETEADHLIAQGNSIIDVVREDLDTLRRLNMSHADQTKVDDWLALLREVEQGVIPLACNAEAAEAMGVNDAAVKAAGSGGFGVDQETQWKLGGDMMMKLIALNLMCDQNRSVLLHWGGAVTFKWDGMDFQYAHHGLSHRNGDDGVTSSEDLAGVEDMIQLIDAWYAERYARLVSLLDNIQEEEGKSLLDNSYVMWLPELSDGDAHNNDHLPICIAGSLGGYLKQGYSVELPTLSGGGQFDFFGGGHPVNRLYTTILNGLGATEEDGSSYSKWGLMDSNAGFDSANPMAEHLQYPGEIDEIKA